MTPDLSLGIQLKTAKVAPRVATCVHNRIFFDLPNAGRKGAITLADFSAGSAPSSAAAFPNTITKGGVLAAHYDDRLFFIGLGSGSGGVCQSGAEVPSNAPAAGKTASTQEKTFA